MKKLIAISVMIALIAGAVFAETSIAGNVESQVNVFYGEFGNHDVEGTDDEGNSIKIVDYDGGFPKPTTSGALAGAWFQIANTNDDGTLGGLFRIRMTDIADSTLRYHRVFVWWKPIDQIKFFLGQDADGMFATGQLTDWAFHQGSEGFLAVHHWDYWREIFPGNWDTFGAAFSFYLIPALDLNLVVPIGQPTGWPRHDEKAVTRTSKFEEIYPGSLQLTAGYGIEGVGKIFFAWIGSGADYFDIDKTKTTTFGRIGLSFYSGSLVEGLGFQVGGSTQIQQKGVDGVDDEGKVIEAEKFNPAPIQVGAAVHWAAGDFGVKWRIGTDIDTSDAKDLFLTTNVMPWINTGFGKICLDIGISMSKVQDQKTQESETSTGFWINPYVKKGISGGYFQFGLLITNNIDGLGNTKIGKEDQKEFVKVYFPVLLGINF